MPQLLVRKKHCLVQLAIYKISQILNCQYINHYNHELEIIRFIVFDYAIYRGKLFGRHYDISFNTTTNIWKFGFPWGPLMIRYLIWKMLIDRSHIIRGVIKILHNFTKKLCNDIVYVLWRHSLSVVTISSELTWNICFPIMTTYI